MTDYNLLRRMADNSDQGQVASATALALVDIAESLNALVQQEPDNWTQDD